MECNVITSHIILTFASAIGRGTDLRPERLERFFLGFG